MLGASARYSRLYVPVETSTPPNFYKVYPVCSDVMRSMSQRAADYTVSGAG